MIHYAILLNINTDEALVFTVDKYKCNLNT